MSYKDRDYYQKLIESKQVAIGTLKLGRQSKVANVHIAVPIYSDLDQKEKSKLRGYITAGIKAKLIENIVQRILKGKENLNALIVEENHRVIADSSQNIPILQCYQTPLPSEKVVLISKGRLLLVSKNKKFGQSAKKSRSILCVGPCGLACQPHLLMNKLVLPPLYTQDIFLLTTRRTVHCRD